MRIRKILYGYKFTYRYVQKRTRVFDGLATPQGVYDWWLKKTENQIAMHPATQYFVTEVFKELAFCESVTPITRRHLKTYLKHSSLNKWCKGMNKYKYWRAENGSETQN